MCAIIYPALIAIGVTFPCRVVEACSLRCCCCCCDATSREIRPNRDDRNGGRRGELNKWKNVSYWVGSERQIYIYCTRTEKSRRERPLDLLSHSMMSLFFVFFLKKCIIYSQFFYTLCVLYNSMVNLTSSLRIAQFSSVFLYNTQHSLLCKEK